MYRRLNWTLLLIVFFASGCASFESKLYNDRQGYIPYVDGEAHRWSKRKGDKSYHPGCNLGGPHSTQGHRLCNSLLHVQEIVGNIQNRASTSTSSAFDITRIGLAILSAAAIAADSHVSVLEGLGIAFATSQGLQTYRNLGASRVAWGTAAARLSCLDQSTRALLWDDSWYFEMRRLRASLHNAMGDLAGFEAVATNSTLKKQATDILSAAGEAMTLADDAVKAYAALAPAVDLARVQIVAAMQTEISEARDVEGAVQSILAARAIQSEREAELQEEVEQVEEAADQGSTGSGQESIDQPATMAAATMLVEMAEATNGLKPLALSSRITSKVAELTFNGAKVKATPDVLLAAALKSIAGSMKQIANIAPRYTQAQISVEACVP